MFNYSPEACVPTTFSSLSLFGSQILSIQASQVTNFNASASANFRFTQPSVAALHLTICNVTVTYTHPGQGDKIKVEAWLPVDTWNGRLQAVGGGYWVAGAFDLSYENMRGAVADGYATTTTDAGVSTDLFGGTEWALLSPGNANLYGLNNLASVSLNDQGGRQGFMLAQRYPEAYNGIAAGAPAIYWPELFGSLQWPQQVMNVLGSYPYACELVAITAAAVSACDGLDGVIDGIITGTDACIDIFDPFTVVGRSIQCSQTNTTITITKTAAAVANAAWRGPILPEGGFVWHGLSPGADLSGTQSFGGIGVAGTNCTSGACTGMPVIGIAAWLKFFIAKDANFDFSHLTNNEFAALIHAGRQQYGSIIGTDDPDLTAFRDAGGKIVSFHGLDDQGISPKATEQYHQAVDAVTHGVDEFFRHYEVPGLQHCFGGPSGNPTRLFEQLRLWVENGTAPGSTPVEVKGLDGKTQQRVVCPYPQKALYENCSSEGGPRDCWSCVDQG